MMNNYLVSICIITYNQEKYIEQALKSIFMQKTNFPFQVIISDDCSTDNTSQIIKRYKEQYPDKLKAFFQEQNLGVIKNYIFCLSQAKTKYVLVNEGDDYFLDPEKLQKQVNFLENKPDYSMCFHYVKVIHENKEKKDILFPKKNMIKNGCSFDTLLKQNFMQTNSVLYRWNFINKDIKDYFPEGILPGDWYLHLLHAKEGKIGFIPEVMSVYRRQEEGIWYEKKNGEIYLKYGMELIKFYCSVWENLTNKSDKYFQETLIPSIKTIAYSYYSEFNIEKLAQIKESFPHIINSIDFKETIYSKKLKKYKKLLTIMLMITEILTVLLAGMTYLYIIK